MLDIHNPHDLASPLDTKLVNITDQARRVDVSPWVLRNAARRSGVPIVKLGKSLFISEEAAKQLLTPRPPATSRASAKPTAGASITGAGAEPDLESAPTA